MSLDTTMPKSASEELELQASSSGNRGRFFLFVVMGITLIAVLILIFFIIPKLVHVNLSDKVGSDVGNLGDAGGTVLTGSESSKYNCDTDIYNCGNFTTEIQAQKVYDACFNISGDVHQLDGDGNGKACEGLD